MITQSLDLHQVKRTKTRKYGIFSSLRLPSVVYPGIKVVMPALTFVRVVASLVKTRCAFVTSSARFHTKYIF